VAGSGILGIHPDSDLPEDVGSKAMGLKRLMELGYAVPSAWVIRRSAAVHEIDELAERLEELEVGLLAVRSSGTVEDGVRRALAAEPLTLLGVSPPLLREAVRRVSESSIRARRGARRRALSIRPASGPCAVIVQELVCARAAGVAVGRWRGSREIVIEAVSGSGEPEAGGSVTPEVVEVFPVGDEWDVRYRRAARPTTAPFADRREVRREARREVRRGPTGCDPRAPLLSPASAREIAEAVAELQWDQGKPLRLEWAQSNGKIWWLEMACSPAPPGAARASGPSTESQPPRRSMAPALTPTCSATM
jgi:phosphoenolpyruvate synthase/pyruvate phosphate dikinase